MERQPLCAVVYKGGVGAFPYAIGFQQIVFLLCFYNCTFVLQTYIHSGLKRRISQDDSHTASNGNNEKMANKGKNKRFERILAIKRLVAQLLN